MMETAEHAVIEITKRADVLKQLSKEVPKY